jgi:hypothetical protein
MLAPMMLVLYAFATQDGIVAKTAIIVDGLQLIVDALGVALALRAVYLLGLRKASTIDAALAVRADFTGVS